MNTNYNAATVRHGIQPKPAQSGLWGRYGREGEVERERLPRPREGVFLFLDTGEVAGA